jgi:uncharacterized protein YbjT (DUF2867 family)
VRILVAGGTGTAGRPTVAELVRRGHEVRVLSRRGGDAGVPGATALTGDAMTGEGVTAALRGVDVVVDCLNVMDVRRTQAARFFVSTTRRLLVAGGAAGVGHHVLLSVVGIGPNLGYGYYDAKFLQEQAAAAGPVPSTVLRSTQFHELLVQIATRLRLGPLCLLPAARVQPIAAAAAAAALADVAEGQPAGRVPDVGGPRVEELADLACRALAARGLDVSVARLPVPGRFGHLAREGRLLPRDGRELGPTFDDWLRTRA